MSILSDPMDCSPPPMGFSAHLLRQAKVLEWVAIAFSVLTVGLLIQKNNCLPSSFHFQ